MALEEKGLAYEDKLISFSKNEHRSEEFLKVSPRGKVPVLQDGDLQIFESNAIIDYLEYTYPEVALLPADKKARAVALAWRMAILFCADRICRSE